MTSTWVWLSVGLLSICSLGIGGAFLFSYVQTLILADPYPMAKDVPGTPRSIIRTVVAPTPTPLTPTPPAVLIAAGTPPAGWVEFRTDAASLWLPANFVGGDLVHSKQRTISKINALGSFYRNAVVAIQQTNEESVLWMVDKTPKQTDIITTVNVRHIISTEDVSLDQYIHDFLAGNVQGTPVAMLLTVNGTKKVTLLGMDAMRLSYSTFYAGHSTSGFLYYIKDGADIWVVNYGLGPEEYYDMLPMVEQSIQTFNLIK
jgi:hypothetical protein